MNWKERLKHEFLVQKSSIFLTLTYSDEEYAKFAESRENPFMSLNHEHVKLFIKRLRKKIFYRIKYFCAGEYGEENMRPHYHLIMFGLSKKDKNVIARAWQNGFIHLGETNETTIRYTVGYIVDKLMGKNAEVYEMLNIKPPYCAVSQGLGLNYAKQYFDNWIAIGKTLPRYYQKKLDSYQKLIYDTTDRTPEDVIPLTGEEESKDLEQRSKNVLAKLALYKRKKF